MEDKLKRIGHPSTWTSSNGAARLTDWLLAVSFIMAIVAYAYLGSYSRYMADDYFVPPFVEKNGLLGAQIHWYRGWTGRFSFAFVADLLALLGPATARFVPGFLLTLWFAAAVWAIAEVCSLSGKCSRPRVLLFAAFVIFATLETAPNLSQSLYWQNSALTHVTPFIPLALFVAVITRGARETNSRYSRRLYLVCAGVLTLVAGGFSDAFAVLQPLALILSTLGVQVAANADLRSRLRPFLLAGLIGSILALIIVAGAPGNSSRMAFFPRQLGAWGILRSSALYSVRFAGKLILTHPIIALASLTLPLLIRVRDFAENDPPLWNRRQCISLLLITPAAVFLLIMCCIGLGFYALSVMPPERALILLCLILIGGMLVWSRAAGEYLLGRFVTVSPKIRLASTLVLLSLVLFSQLSFFSILGTRAKARGFAADWDREDSELKTAKQNGVTDVAVQQIGDFQSRIGRGPSDLHLRTDSSFWINRTVAKYYGLTSVRATEDVDPKAEAR